MPRDIGDFPHRSHIAAYFERFAVDHGLHPFIRFRTQVTAARPRSDGGYDVESRSLATGAQSTERFDALVIASGHHFQARVPELPGHFSGLSLHSSEYRSPTEPFDLREKNVVVVGLGNSAVDIACELSRVRGEKRTFVAARRGAWVLPKYMRGRPIDEGHTVPLWLPGKLRRRIVTALFRLFYGKMETYGLPAPDHLIGEAHPTISNEFLALSAKGELSVRPALTALDGTRASFADGTQESVDAVVFCTGYDVTFPFLPSEHVTVKDNELPLYLRIFPPQQRRLFFVGLAQPLGAIFPIADAQARLIAEHLTGTYALPEAHELERAIEEERATMRERFVASRRHTMQLIPEDYQKALRAELTRGRRRASLGKGQRYSLPANDVPNEARASEETTEASL